MLQKAMYAVPVLRASAALTLVFLVAALAQWEGVPSDPSSVAGGGDGRGGGMREIVRKERLPYRTRQKRAWIWNSYYVTEESEMISPKKIGKLKSSKTADGTTFKLRGDGANSIFTVNRNGDLFVIKTLDREEKSMYNLTALLYDGRDQLVEDAGEFVVQVNDINDHIPVFPRTYNESILERSGIGAKVVQVTATDADDPSTVHAELRYSLRPEGERSAFEINIITGMITSRVDTLDREDKSQYVLVVQAKDMRGMTTGTTATTSVTVTITDINDNMASFTQDTYDLSVPENQRLEEKIGTLTLDDRDEIQNKEPVFTIQPNLSSQFALARSLQKDGHLMLKKALDYETKSSYSFIVDVHENSLQFPADNKDVSITKARVNIRVLDVDEPPVFSKPSYAFSVMEEEMATNIGIVSATDPDQANKAMRYSVEDQECPVGVNPVTGQLFILRKLDRELRTTHIFQVRAQEEPSGLHSLVRVNISVQDLNDNAPELVWDDIFVCENDMAGTVIGRLSATDRDEQVAYFHYSLVNPSDNFTITKNASDNTAVILVRQGTFRLDDPRDYTLGVRVDDGGRPPRSSVMHVPIKVCRCDSRRIHTQCKAAALRMGVSIHALIAILVCILTILVIVILVVMRRRFQKESLASMKHSGEIHEQLVTYDEEGGGEMDTNGYDVSILTSARHDGSLLLHPDHGIHPSLYARVQKQPCGQLHQQHHPLLPPHLLPPPQPPAACKGDMAVMIEAKKDEADADREAVPYDTLHIYGYEGGPGSLAGSLSSLESSCSSAGSGGPEYDFLSDWGPRFRTLAELYGVDELEAYLPY
ncbi:cadherin-5 [Gadus macrocephalus]|uniref:cadherin-5 n=1 Tax=Gadus macrocephalus TaxID=80720 RepID=UPI0028CB9CAF|nr:cadherin-5 [Gadus macrocephalus]